MDHEADRTLAGQVCVPCLCRRRERAQPKEYQSVCVSVRADKRERERSRGETGRFPCIFPSSRTRGSWEAPRRANVRSILLLRAPQILSLTLRDVDIYLSLFVVFFSLRGSREKRDIHRDEAESDQQVEVRQPVGEDQGRHPGDLRRAAIRHQPLPGRGAQVRHAPLRPRHLVHAHDGVC